MSFSVGNLESEAPAVTNMRIALFLWGPPKTGKTSWAATAPGRKLWLLYDPDGTNCLAGATDIEVLDMTKLKPNELVKLPNSIQFHNMLEREADNFDTLVFDTVTSYYYTSLLDAINRNIGASSKSGFKPSIEEPGQTAYGARKANTVETLVNLLKITGRLRKHMIIIGHEGSRTTDNAGNWLFTAPSVSENTVNDFNTYISEIWHFDRDGNKQTVMTLPGRKLKPMGTRMFRNEGDGEFNLKFDPSAGVDQPHSLAALYDQWRDNGFKPIPLPK